MASKARKERRRLEREARERQQLHDQGDRLRQILGLTGIDERVTQELQHEAAFVDAGMPALVEIVHRDLPAYAERAKKEFEQHGESYEEANWAKLSPTFRLAHNRLRQQRGMPPIPPPAVDLYRPPLVKHVDPIELERLAREAQIAKAQFLGQQRHMAPGREGFTINGDPLKF
jgi:hypothetical protein